MSNYSETSKDIGSALGVHEQTVRTWARKGKIPGIELPGKGWRFNRQEVIEFITKGRDERLQESRERRRDGLDEYQEGRP